MLSAEDRVAETIRPRLELAEADLSRVHVIDYVEVTETGERRWFSLPNDLVALEKMVREEEARLIVVDPFVAYLAQGISANNEQDVRHVLGLFSQMAERTGAAVLLIRHFNKSAVLPALYRPGGSIGISAAIRSELLVFPDRQDETSHTRVLASSQCNLSAPPSALAYRLVGSGSSVRVEWLGVSSATVADLGREPEDEMQRHAQREAEDFLRSELSANPVESKDDPRACQIRRPCFPNAQSSKGGARDHEHQDWRPMAMGASRASTCPSGGGEGLGGLPRPASTGSTNARSQTTENRDVRGTSGLDSTKPMTSSLPLTLPSRPGPGSPYRPLSDAAEPAVCSLRRRPAWVLPTRPASSLPTSSSERVGKLARDALVSWPFVPTCTRASVAKVAHTARSLATLANLPSSEARAERVAGRDAPVTPLQPYQLLPELSEAEFATLKADIAARGVVVPVVVDADSGAIIDGHHRVRAFEALRAEGIRVPAYPRVGAEVRERTGAGGLRPRGESLPAPPHPRAAPGARRETPKRGLVPPAHRRRARRPPRHGARGPHDCRKSDNPRAGARPAPRRRHLSGPSPAPCALDPRPLASR